MRILTRTFETKPATLTGLGELPSVVGQSTWNPWYRKSGKRRADLVALTFQGSRDVLLSKVKWAFSDKIRLTFGSACGALRKYLVVFPLEAMGRTEKQILEYLATLSADPCWSEVQHFCRVLDSEQFESTRHWDWTGFYRRPIVSSTVTPQIIGNIDDAFSVLIQSNRFVRRSPSSVGLLFPVVEVTTELNLRRAVDFLINAGKLKRVCFEQAFGFLAVSFLAPQQSSLQMSFEELCRGQRQPGLGGYAPNPRSGLSGASDRLGSTFSPVMYPRSFRKRNIMKGFGL